MIQYQESKTLQFRRACKEVRKLRTRLEDGELLQLYGLYKQVIIGDNTTEKPWSINVKKKAKWDTWFSYKGKSRDKARSEYVVLVGRLKERLGVSSVTR